MSIPAPGRRWPILLAGAGLAALLSLNLPAVAGALDSPAFCGSCHVMQGQVESHLRSPHRAEACGHCHLPRGLLRYPLAKAWAGARDVFALMAGTAPETIRLAPGGGRVVQGNCLHCHGAMAPDTAARGGHLCFDCHRGVAHGP